MNQAEVSNMEVGEEAGNELNGERERGREGKSRRRAIHLVV